MEVSLSRSESRLQRLLRHFAKTIFLTMRTLPCYTTRSRSISSKIKSSVVLTRSYEWILKRDDLSHLHTIAVTFDEFFFFGTLKKMREVEIRCTKNSRHRITRIWEEWPTTTPHSERSDISRCKEALGLLFHSKKYVFTVSRFRNGLWKYFTQLIQKL